MIYVIIGLSVLVGVIISVLVNKRAISYTIIGSVVIVLAAAFALFVINYPNYFVNFQILILSFVVAIVVLVGIYIVLRLIVNLLLRPEAAFAFDGDRVEKARAVRLEAQGTLAAKPVRTRRRRAKRAFAYAKLDTTLKSDNTKKADDISSLFERTKQASRDIRKESEQSELLTVFEYEKPVRPSDAEKATQSLVVFEETEQEDIAVGIGESDAAAASVSEETAEQAIYAADTVDEPDTEAVIQEDATHTDLFAAYLSDELSKAETAEREAIDESDAAAASVSEVTAEQAIFAADTVNEPDAEAVAQKEATHTDLFAAYLSDEEVLDTEVAEDIEEPAAVEEIHEQPVLAEDADIIEDIEAPAAVEETDEQPEIAEDADMAEDIEAPVAVEETVGQPVLAEDADIAENIEETAAVEETDEQPVLAEDADIAEDIETPAAVEETDEQPVLAEDADIIEDIEASAAVEETDEQPVLAEDADIIEDIEAPAAVEETVEQPVSAKDTDEAEEIQAPAAEEEGQDRIGLLLTKAQDLISLEKYAYAQMLAQTCLEQDTNGLHHKRAHILLLECLVMTKQTDSARKKWMEILSKSYVLESDEKTKLKTILGRLSNG